MLTLQPRAQRCDQLFGDGLAADPAHIKGILMGQGVVVEQLHRHRGRQLLGRLEQAHQQRGPQEVVDHAITDAELFEQRQRIDGVVAPVHRIAAVEIEHGVEQPGDAEPVGQRQPPEVPHRGQHLPHRTGQLRGITEHGRRGLQPIRRPEGTGGEVGVDRAQTELIGEGIDVGVVLPEAAGAGLERLAAAGGDRFTAAGIGHAVDQGHAHTGLAERLGRTPARPAGTDHHHMGLLPP